MNASKQLRNDVLDAVEPFLWEEARPFAWEYLAGQRVKLRDVEGSALAGRVRSEVEGDFLPSVEKTMHTRGVELYMQEGALVEMPLLLPVYFISQKGMCVALNGQTGAVAGWFGETKDSNRLWFLEPALTTLAVGLRRPKGGFVKPPFGNPETFNRFARRRHQRNTDLVPFRPPREP